MSVDTVAPRTTAPQAVASGTVASAPRTEIRFAERARLSGVDFTYHNGEEADRASMLETLGGGVALFDYDADGDVDLFFTGGGTLEPGGEILGLPSALFRCDGPARYAPVTEAARLSRPKHYSHGVAVADFDQDGFPDLLITGYGGLQVCRNAGDGTFADVTESAGLHDTSWSTSAAWGDLNGDQHSDLYIAHYLDWSIENDPGCPGPERGQRETCSPRLFEPLPDVLYFSNGDGTFRDGSSEAGLRKDGKGLGVVIADLDGDRHCDIYVANDTVANFLYRNNGRGEFQEVGLESGTALNETGGPDGSMGVAVGDFNRDGLPDVWVTNYEREAFALYRNEGNCLFQHVSRVFGVTAVGGLFVGFGTLFFDMDRDGDEDLFVTNGHVYRFPENAPRKQKPLLFENRAGARFENEGPRTGPYFDAPHMGRGVAAGDLDGDGDLDLVVTHTGESHALLENQTQSDGKWLSVRLIGTRSNRDAVGAHATLVTSAGRLVRQVMGGGSYLSHSDTRLFWGIPAGSDIQELIIHWPAGGTQSLTAIEPNRTLTLIEPTIELTASPESGD